MEGTASSSPLFTSSIPALLPCFAPPAFERLLNVIFWWCRGNQPLPPSPFSSSFYMSFSGNDEAFTPCLAALLSLLLLHHSRLMARQLSLSLPSCPSSIISFTSFSGSDTVLAPASLPPCFPASLLVSPLALPSLYLPWISTEGVQERGNLSQA